MHGTNMNITNKIYVVKEIILMLRSLSAYTPFDFGIKTIVYFPKIGTTGDDSISTVQPLLVTTMLQDCYLIIMVPNICAVLMINVCTLCAEVPSFEFLLTVFSVGRVFDSGRLLLPYSCTDSPTDYEY